MSEHLASKLAATQSSWLLHALYPDAILSSAQASVLSRGQSSPPFGQVLYSYLSWDDGTWGWIPPFGPEQASINGTKSSGERIRVIRVDASDTAE